MHVPCRNGPLKDGPLVMGILNVTPDSFSDGGLWLDPKKAVDHAFDLIDQGADIIDIGAESTRPGSNPVTAEQEIERLEPVLRDLIPSIDVPVSIDTMKPSVASRCISLGVDIINDVWGLRAEGMAKVCADGGAAVIIMHMAGTPDTVHSTEMGPTFREEIRRFLSDQAEFAIDAGIPKDRIMVDPGMGFGKTPAQNMDILEHSSDYSCGFPILMASSRKRFLKEYFPSMERDDASAEAVLISVRSGADMVRVHNVARTVEVLRKDKLRQ